MVRARSPAGGVSTTAGGGGVKCSKEGPTRGAPSSMTISSRLSLAWPVQVLRCAALRSPRCNMPRVLFSAIDSLTCLTEIDASRMDWSSDQNVTRYPSDHISPSANRGPSKKTWQLGPQLHAHPRPSIVCRWRAGGGRSI